MLVVGLGLGFVVVVVVVVVTGGGGGGVVVVVTTVVVVVTVVGCSVVLTGFCPAAEAPDPHADSSAVPAAATLTISFLTRMSAPSPRTGDTVMTICPWRRHRSPGGCPATPSEDKT